MANLSALPDHVIDLIDAGLKGTPLVPAAEAVTITRSLPHGHVAAVAAMAAKLGLPALLGPAGRQRDLALALIISRVVAPASKLSTLTWWADTTLGADLGVDGASTDDIYAAMDWLAGQQDAHRGRGWPPGTWPRTRTRRRWPCSTCPARGWKARSARWPPAGTPGTARKASCRSSTGCSPTPRAARSRSGSSPATPATRPRSPRSSRVVRDKFGLRDMVMVGDRGMITSARIAALNQAEDGTARPDPYGWITALRAPAIRKLMADDGPLQLVAVRPAGPGRDHQPRTSPASG